MPDNGIGKAKREIAELQQAVADLKHIRDEQAKEIQRLRAKAMKWQNVAIMFIDEARANG